MKKQNYENALTKLTEILENIQNNEISLDDLPKEISTANELIKICKQKLRNIETQLDNIESEDQP